VPCFKDTTAVGFLVGALLPLDSPLSVGDTGPVHPCGTLHGVDLVHLRSSLARIRSRPCVAIPESVALF